MIKSYWDEKWKKLEFEPGEFKLNYAVSTYGRVISYTDSIEKGTLLKGSLVNGYRLIKMKNTKANYSFYLHKFRSPDLVLENLQLR